MRSRTTPALWLPVALTGWIALALPAWGQETSAPLPVAPPEREEPLDLPLEVELERTLERVPDPSLPLPSDLLGAPADARPVWEKALGGAWRATADAIGAGTNRVLARMPQPVRLGVRDLREMTFTAEAREVLLVGSSLLLVVLLLMRLLRGRGDLTVLIEYPSELRGTFTVRLGRLHWRPGPSRVASAESAERRKHNAGTASRTTHPLVSRETRFRGLPARRHVVMVDGFIQANDAGALVTSHVEEQPVRLRRGRTERLVFDFHPKHCPSDVRVTWDGKLVPEALVALRGVQGSLRYQRGVAVRIGIPLGPHAVVAGSGDRVAEKPVEISSFQPMMLDLDLADRDILLFTGCPPAVEPYLHGDVPAAAEALERDGQQLVSHRLLARYHRDQERLDEAARHFELADQPLEAAALCESLGDYERSAALYESGGDLDRAAEMFREAGAWVRAGEVFERVRQFETAVECYRQAQDVPRWVDALEKYGSAFQAAQVAIEHEQTARAIRALQQVTSNDPHYLQSAEMLVDLYQKEGHLDLAVRKIEEVLARKGEDQAPLQVCDRLASLLEASGDYDRALDMLELIRRRDATWPNLATRIEELRKRRSKERGTTAPLGATSGHHFTSEFRYEILEEVGRGGMGIVFKARDRRLGRVVALKRLPDNLRNHPKAVELFLREARAAAALNHPNIVTLFDAGQEGDSYYITMELLEGHPLQQILKRRGTFGVRDTARLGIQVANGLQYAHDHGVVHRDIKTGNLFFTQGKVVKIMDFGLAKMVEEVRRATTVIGGTPYYMAPEQSAGGRVDHRVDVYALGVTLFEFLTGRVPFDDGDVAYQHRHTPPPDPREIVPEIPQAFAELLLQMLAKRADDRVPSARAAAERLQEFSKKT